MKRSCVTALNQSNVSKLSRTFLLQVTNSISQRVSVCTSLIIDIGICEESYDYGRKETKDIKLTTRVVSSGNKIWLPDVSQLPKTDLNSDKLPLVSGKRVLTVKP